MDLKKLFKSKKAPDIVGTDAPQLDIPTEVVNKIYLQFSDLEGEPTYELEDKLTIGSESGDIIFDDPSLAPKHCTFTHAQDVISIMDHASAEGTFINKKQVPAGRVLILQEKDKIRIGDLTVKLILQEELAPIDEVIAEEANDENIDSEVMERMQTLAGLKVPELKEESAQESIPDIPPDATAEIQVPDDLTLDDEMEVTSTNLGVEESDLSDDDLLAEEDITEEDEEFEDIEEVEKKPGLFGKLFKKKTKEINEEDQEEEEVTEDTVLVDLDDDEEMDEKTRKILRASGGKNAKVKSKSSVSESSNTLVRVFALILEILIVLFSLTFLSPLKEFQNAVLIYPVKIWLLIKDMYTDFAKVHYDEFLKEHVDKLLKEVPAVNKGMDEVVEFLSNNPQVLYGIYLFILIRLVTPILFGVSIGQGMIGIRAAGNFFVKRITAIFRELLGFITFIFLIFDLPALFSKRTFKEIMTFSHIETKSTGKTTVLTFFWIFAFLVLYIALPVIEYGKQPQVLPVEAFPLKPMQIKLAGDIVSRDLKIMGKLPEKHIVLPLFSVIQKQKKRSIVSSYKVLDVETGNYIKMTRLKTVSLPLLLKKGIEGNYLASWKYPEIQKITNDVSGANKNFKVDENLNVEKISNEIGLLLKGSFGLSIEKVHQHMMKHGPFLKGYLEFQKTLLGHLDITVQSIKMDYIGASPFVLFSPANKKKLVGLTINKRNADIYSFESRNNIDNTLPIIENLGFSQAIESDSSSLNMFVVVDKLMSFTKINKETFQGIYEFLFEKSKDIMISKDKFLIKELEKSIASIIQFSDILENKHKDKFFQNTSDMLQAIKDEDISYFGVTDIKTARVK